MVIRRLARNWRPTFLAILLGLAPHVAAQSSAGIANAAASDDTAFFDAYLAAKRESPRAPAKALIESALWAQEENTQPRRPTDAGRTGSPAPSPEQVADKEILALNQALAPLAGPSRHAGVESRNLAIGQLRRLATAETMSPPSRHLAVLWIAQLLQQNGQIDQALQDLAAIDLNSPRAIDAMLVWARLQPDIRPAAAAAVEHHIAERLPASAAAWQARETLITSLLAQGATSQAGEVAIAGVGSAREQLEGLDQLLARLKQATTPELLTAIQYLPAQNGRKVASLLERREKLSVETRLNAWLPYFFSYRGQLQSDPDKFIESLGKILRKTRAEIPPGPETTQKRLGLLRQDIQQIVGTPPAAGTAHRLFAALAKWELDADYPAIWQPENEQPNPTRALEHAGQLLDRMAARYRTSPGSKGAAIDALVKSVAERNNALTVEIRGLSPRIEQALRDEVLAGLRERRRINQQWMSRFAFHALEAFSRHDPEIADLRFEIDHLPALLHGQPIVAQLQEISGSRHLQKHARPSVAPVASALQLLIDAAEDRGLKAGAMRLRAQLIIAQTEAGITATATEAIALYQHLLKDYTDLVDRAETGYQLAHAQALSQQPAEHLASLNALVATYPGTHWAQEATFRIGEIHFASGDYPRARHAYASIMSAGESRYRAPAEYMLGWTNYKLDQFREALPHFIAAIDRAGDQSRTSASGTDRFARATIKDSFRAIVLTFSKLGGDGEIERYFNRPGRRQHLPEIMASVAALHLERERVQDAANTYEALVRQYPNHPRGPELLAEIVRVAQRLGLNQLALAEKERFAQRYTIGSPFWQQAKPETRMQLGADLRLFLTELATLYHADAQQQNASPSRDKAIQYYGQYIDGFSTDPELGKLLFLRAEARIEAGDLENALADYDRSAYGVGLHAKASEASYAALVTSEKLIARGDTPEQRRNRLRDLVSRAAHFARSFAGDGRVDAVLAKAGEDILMLGEAGEAIRLGENLLARQPGPEIRRRAEILLAHGLFESGNFERAVSAYKQALASGGHAGELEKTLRQRYGLALYRQAEALRAAGHAELATAAFLSIGRLAPDSEIVPHAEIDAAALMLANQRWPESIELLERFIRERPNHVLATTVPARLALAYEKTGRLLLAAELLEALSLAESGKGSLGDMALAAQQQRRAGELREREGRHELATASFERYLARFPEPLEAATEIRQRLADLAVQTGNQATRDRWLNEIITTAKTNGNSGSVRIRYLAAHAHLTLGDAKTTEFEKIPLRQPFEKTLTDKRTALELAVGWYENAGRYAIAEITTAATFKTAELYRRLAQDILHSERPANLTPLELEQYQILLEEAALPFEDKAIKLHELNLDRIAGGKPGGIFDEWVKRSIGSLRTLEPGRYDRAEAIGSYFPYLLPSPAPMPLPVKTTPTAGAANSAEIGHAKIGS